MTIWLINRYGCCANVCKICTNSGRPQCSWVAEQLPNDLGYPAVIQDMARSPWAKVQWDFEDLSDDSTMSDQTKSANSCWKRPWHHGLTTMHRKQSKTYIPSASLVLRLCSQPSMKYHKVNEVHEIQRGYKFGRTSGSWVAQYPAFWNKDSVTCWVKHELCLSMPFRTAVQMKENLQRLRLQELVEHQRIWFPQSFPVLTQKVWLQQNGTPAGAKASLQFGRSTLSTHRHRSGSFEFEIWTLSDFEGLFGRSKGVIK